MEDIPMSIIVHYGGSWEETSTLVYVGGTTKIFDELPNDVNASYFKNMIDSLGYGDICKLHYCDPVKRMDEGMRFLSYDDATFVKFLSLLHMYRVMDVFVEHEEESEDELNGRGSFTSLLERSNPRVGEMTVVDDIDYDDEGSDNEDVEVITAREQIASSQQAEKDLIAETESILRLKDRSSEKCFGDESSGSDSDEDCPGSPAENQDEEYCGNLIATPPKAKRKKGVTHSKHMQSVNLRNDDGKHFTLGQQFEDVKEFRNAITNYCVSQGRDVVYTRNAWDRMGAKCKSFDKGCPWYIWASKKNANETMVVKTLIPKHSCGRQPKVKKIRASWVAKTYHNKFKVNPYLKCQEIVDTIWTEWGVKISMWMALKARRKAQELIIGEYEEQYSLLHRYAAEILRSNPKNTVKFKMGLGKFERIYVCFDAIRNGFLAGCRPFFGIDGCFLKGPFGGQLLVAVGRDGNNQMYPIAWALVEVEDTDSWCWFLEILADDLGTIDGFGYTIMSDQQKGLLKAISLIFPRAETRCCARHVYCNFRTVFGGGLQYRRGFWKIAKSTTDNEFEANMELFSDINTKAAQDLRKRNYVKWVRAFFTPQSQCDSIDNNMNEVFNAYILASRHKPIITMLEDIREGLMERMHKKRDFIQGKDIAICPRIQKKLEKAKIDARGWVAYWDGHFSYGVREGGTQTRYVVSLLERTCSCNAWQISGVPCHHAVTAIWKAMEQPEHYVSHWFTKNTYLKAYQCPLEPLNGPDEWPQTSQVPIIPPMLKKVNHRPTTKRRPSMGETEGIKLGKKGVVHKCSNCGEAGHKKTTCIRPPKQPSQRSTQTGAPRQHVPTQESQSQSQGGSSSTPRQHVPTQESQAYVPMHERGIGVYTYPNGFQRQSWKTGNKRKPNSEATTTIETITRL